MRANSSVVQRNAETTTRAPQRQAVTMWTRPAPTSPPLLHQRFMEKATPPAPAGSRITASSQEIRLRNTPTNSRGDPTTTASCDFPIAESGSCHWTREPHCACSLRGQGT